LMQKSVYSDTGPTEITTTTNAKQRIKQSLATQRRSPLVR
jgi:hypothetical protein